MNPNDDCEPCRISRRALIKGAGAATTVAVAVPALGAGMAFASTNATRRGDVIVNVFLRGGMDGLSLVVPRHEGAGAGDYLAARPTIAVDPAAVLPLTPDFGLHPTMSALVPLWQAGRLALLPTAGFPLDDRSHFTVQRQMDYGAALGGGGTGWLARHLNAVPGTDPVGVRAANLPYGQRSMQGATVSVTMGSVESFRLNGFNGSGGMAQAALRALHEGGTSIVDQRARQAIDALDLVAAAPIDPPANGAQYPATGRGRRFGESMRQIAQLIRADVGLEAAATESSLGWDYHSDFGPYTGGAMQGSLEALSQVLAAFATDLGPLMDKVTVVLMTEFGRTFRENGNAGLDHGRASTMMVIGGGVRGGLYGDWPGLAPADIDRNALRVTVDYRYVLADILEHRLHNPNLGGVLPGFVPDPALRLNLCDPLDDAVAPSATDAVLVPPVVGAAPTEPAAPRVEQPAAEVPSDAPATSGPGTYVWVAPEGAVVHLDVPAPSEAPDVAAVEAARASLGATGSSYVVARIDNAAGTGAVVPPMVSVANAAGAPSAFREAWIVLGEWIAASSGVDLTAAEALVADLRARATVPAGGSAAVVLVAAGALTDIAEVRVGTGASSVALAQALPLPVDATAGAAPDEGGS